MLNHIGKTHGKSMCMFEKKGRILARSMERESMCVSNPNDGGGFELMTSCESTGLFANVVERGFMNIRVKTNFYISFFCF